MKHFSKTLTIFPINFRRKARTASLKSKKRTRIKKQHHFLHNFIKKRINFNKKTTARIGDSKHKDDQLQKKKQLRQNRCNSIVADFNKMKEKDDLLQQERIRSIKRKKIICLAKKEDQIQQAKQNNITIRKRKPEIKRKR